METTYHIRVYIRVRVPLKQIEFGLGYNIIRSPYTPYSIYLRGTIDFLWHKLSEGSAC